MRLVQTFTPVDLEAVVDQGIPTPATAVFIVLKGDFKHHFWSEMLGRSNPNKFDLHDPDTLLLDVTGEVFTHQSREEIMRVDLTTLNSINEMMGYYPESTVTNESFRVTGMIDLQDYNLSGSNFNVRLRAEEQLYDCSEDFTVDLYRVT